MLEQDKVIFTGGSGLLGGEFKQIFPNINYPSRAEFDVTDYPLMEKYLEEKSISLIIHAAAFTSPPKINEDPLLAIDVNIIGTANLVKLCACHGIKLVYISTDYVFKGDQGNYREDDPVYPVNKYAWSKLGGECSVRLYDNSLIIRTTFGPNVFPFEKAFVDQWTSRESVAVIARMIASVLDKDVIGTLHVGGKKKTVFEYAKNLDPSKDVKELSINDINFSVPNDSSLNCERFNKLSINKKRLLS